jgi:hypothetical protein
MRYGDGYGTPLPIPMVAQVGAPDIQISGTAVEGGSLDLSWLLPPIGTTSVTFKDGATTINTDSSAPWEFTVTGLTAGAHAYHAVASPDGTDTGTANVFVAPAAPSVVAPVAEAVSVGASVALDVTTIDDSITSGIDAVITGPASFTTTIHLTLSTGHWTGSWNTSGLSAGNYVVTCVRHTSAGDASALGIAISVAAAFTVQTDTLFAAGTWISPANYKSLSGTANHVLVELWGNGGGGKAATGGGGGGAYAAGDFAGATSTGYAVGGLGTVAIDTDGADTTFNTSSIVAKGGQGRTNGGAGGTAGASIGTTKYTGGAGSTGAGNVFGGGSAGSAGDASTTTGGTPDGTYTAGFGIGSNHYGAGGASSGSLGRAGGVGLAAMTYMIPGAGGACIASAPVITRDTAAALSHTVTPPAGSGGMLIYVVAGAGAATLTMVGFTTLAQASEGSVELACFYAIDTGLLGTTITSTASIRLLTRGFRLTGPDGTSAPGTPFWTTSTGNSTTPDPPSNTGTSASYLVIAAIGIAQSAADIGITAGPSGYVSVRPTTAAFATGPALLTAEKYFTGTTENPGAVTMTSNHWAAGTIFVPPA